MPGLRAFDILSGSQACVRWRVEIVLAKHQGFCGGVRRAVEMSEATGTQTGGTAQTWGPLIHNPQV